MFQLFRRDRSDSSSKETNNKKKEEKEKEEFAYCTPIMGIKLRIDKSIENRIINGIWIDDGGIHVKQKKNIGYFGSPSLTSLASSLTSSLTSNSNSNNNDASSSDAVTFTMSDQLANYRLKMYLKSEFKNFGIYFGGVDFKYLKHTQIEENDENEETYLKQCEQLGQYASQGYMDVVCISGKGTGQAAKSSKVLAYANGTKDNSMLAIASGVNYDNINQYIGKVDAILIASGIEKDFGIFDEQKMLKLRQKINQDELPNV